VPESFVGPAFTSCSATTPAQLLASRAPLLVSASHTSRFPSLSRSLADLANRLPDLKDSEQPCCLLLPGQSDLRSFNAMAGDELSFSGQRFVSA